jgi:hypothetical protein
MPIAEEISWNHPERDDESVSPAPRRNPYAPPRLTEFVDALALTRSTPVESVAGRGSTG